ncbi:MAG TPA: hypothetical protein VEZ90_07365, partial [Blastocatellia bacterium]|nr:hypothetical protein [Blastocatellia bacterium]
KSDYMSTLNNDLDNALNNFVQTATNDTASIKVSPPVIDAGKSALVANVTVTNNTGHRFPSGVGFRRAFIEFDVVDNSQIDPATDQGKIVWSSGRTDEDGLIVDNAEKPLPTEYIGTIFDESRQFQPHFYGPDHPITKSSQVQIYEELVKDAKGDFTTSFVRRDNTHIKDNRLLPIGWNPDGPSPSLTGRYLEATFPEGDARNDPNYSNGSGISEVWYQVPLSELPSGLDMSKVEVRATLYYQTIPPYYLMQRFQEAPTAPGTLRFLYLAAGLRPDHTPIEDWKLKIIGAEAAVRQ